MVTKLVLVVGIAVAIAIVVFIGLQIKANAAVKRMWNACATSPSPIAETHFTESMVADLPEPVQRYFLHAIAPGTPLPGSVQLMLNGQIRLAPAQDWLPVRSQECLSPQGFVWKAVAGKGLMQMRGADAYWHGTGRMRFALWGLLPVVEAHDADTVRSAIGRFTGEFFWLPMALLPQRGVAWSALDQHTLQARFDIDGEAIATTMVIDDDGRLLKSYGVRWGDRTENGHPSYIPFGGNFTAERTFEGVTIPSEIGAGWWFGTERYFEFFRATVEDAHFTGSATPNVILKTEL